MVKVWGQGFCYLCFSIIIIIIIIYLLFYLVLGARYQLGHCPVSFSSCNIYLFYFTLFFFI